MDTEGGRGLASIERHYGGWKLMEDLGAGRITAGSRLPGKRAVTRDHRRTREPSRLSSGGPQRDRKTREDTRPRRFGTVSPGFKSRASGEAGFELLTGGGPYTLRKYGARRRLLVRVRGRPPLSVVAHLTLCPHDRSTELGRCATNKSRTVPHGFA
jgi:hypothetical protein